MKFGQIFRNVKGNYSMCNYCNGGVALVVDEKTTDKGIEICYPNTLKAYGYDVHGTGHNSLSCKINYCPMCGALINSKLIK